MDTVNRAMMDVLTERERQQALEGWSPGHDDTHQGGELALAACCYALNAGKITELTHAGLIRQPSAEDYAEIDVPAGIWPWGLRWWKPKSERRDLVRAAALLIAEIERRDRMEAPDGDG